MWPFSYFGRRRFDRRRKAALIVLLGAWMYEKSPVDVKDRLDSEVDENFNRTDTPAVAWRGILKADAMAAHRAAAMDRLGIPPSIPDLSWAQLFEPWHIWRKVPEWPRKAYDGRPDLLVNDYRLFDPASAEARLFLRTNGLNFPDFYP